MGKVEDSHETEVFEKHFKIEPSEMRKEQRFTIKKTNEEEESKKNFNSNRNLK